MKMVQNKENIRPSIHFKSLQFSRSNIQEDIVLQKSLNFLCEYVNGILWPHTCGLMMSVRGQSRDPMSIPQATFFLPKRYIKVLWYHKRHITPYWYKLKVGPE